MILNRKCCVLSPFGSVGIRLPIVKTTENSSSPKTVGKVEKPVKTTSGSTSQTGPMQQVFSMLEQQMQQVNQLNQQNIQNLMNMMNCAPPCIQCPAPPCIPSPAPPCIPCQTATAVNTACCGQCGSLNTSCCCPSNLLNTVCCCPSDLLNTAFCCPFKPIASSSSTEPEKQIAMESSPSEKFEVTANLKNYSADNITVTLYGDRIEVVAENQEYTPDSCAKEKFCKQFTVPQNIDRDKIQVVLHPDGILKITAPAK